MGIGSDDSVRKICNAPFASMYLDPLGDVRACCMNRWHELGSVRESSLADIWRGPAAEELRERVAVGDLELGCESCSHALRAGGRDAAFLRVFDELDPGGSTPAWPLQLELALSNTCNLQCVMCNGDLSSSIRAHRERRTALKSAYGESFFEELDPFLENVQRVVFLGGEPFLARESLRVMERLTEFEAPPRCHVTTNGTIWNPWVESLVKSLPMHVAVSIDGVTKRTAGMVRVGSDLDDVLVNTRRFRDASTITGGGSSLSYCLMVPTWREFGDLLLLADDLDMDVFVNPVTAPPRFSLYHLSARELSEVVDALAEQATHLRSRLGRNGPVWDLHVAALESSLEAKRDTEVALPGSRCAGVEGITQCSVETDEDQIIRTVKCAGSLGERLGLDDLLGDRLSAVQSRLVERLGRVVSSEIESEPEGLEAIHVVFDSGSSTREVVLRQRVTGDGEMLEIAAG